MKEMIRRFDEVIANKVNKESFDFLKIEIESKYETKTELERKRELNDKRMV
jgi:hypothetical protein